MDSAKQEITVAVKDTVAEREDTFAVFEEKLRNSQASVPYLHHTLVVSSSGEAAKSMPSAMGRYHKVGGELKNDQPVWKKEGGGSSRYIYFNMVSWSLWSSLDKGE